MTARDDILGRIRSAVGTPPPSTSEHADAGVRAGGAGPGGPVPAGRPDRARADLVALFLERVEDYRAVVERCGEEELGERVRSALPAGSTVVVPEGLGVDVPGATLDHPDLSAAALDRIDAVVTRARVAVAETGTLVLDHGPGQGRRVITLVPDRHVCLVHVAQVVPDVPDAVALLDPLRPTTWISGPSATSDIELDRVEGVHGPRLLHVIVVG